MDTSTVTVTALFSVITSVGSIVAALREWRRRTLRTASQAERLGGVAVYGFLPRISASPQEDLAATVPNVTPWLVEFCADIIPETDESDGVVVLISSANRGEGRSTVAVNMAAYLAQGGDRVLLIEADRRGEKRQSTYGLLDVLRFGQHGDHDLAGSAHFATAARGVGAGLHQTGHSLRAAVIDGQLVAAL